MNIGSTDSKGKHLGRVSHITLPTPPSRPRYGITRDKKKRKKKKRYSVLTTGLSHLFFLYIVGSRSQPKLSRGRDPSRRPQVRYPIPRALGRETPPERQGPGITGAGRIVPREHWCVTIPRVLGADGRRRLGGTRRDGPGRVAGASPSDPEGSPAAVIEDWKISGFWWERECSYYCYHYY